MFSDIVWFKAQNFRARTGEAISQITFYYSLECYVEYYMAYPL